MDEFPLGKVIKILKINLSNEIKTGDQERICRPAILFLWFNSPFF